MTTQFSGESNWNSIINDNSLDIVEEESFEQFVIEEGGSKEDSLEKLESLYKEWRFYFPEEGFY